MLVAAPAPCGRAESAPLIIWILYGGFYLVYAWYISGIYLVYGRAESALVIVITACSRSSWPGMQRSGSPVALHAAPIRN